jgi:alanine racemase
MPSGPWALIDHAALRHNLKLARGYAPGSRVWAVIKANAYGHGMVQVAHTLAGADGFAVARVEEAVRLRGARVARPILVLEGAVFPEEVELADQHRVELCIHDEEQVALLEQANLNHPLRVWIKVDTGMHRLGVAPSRVAALIARLSRRPEIARLTGLMTHLANADDPSDPLTGRQCERLRALVGGSRQRLSIGNSAGILTCTASRTDWVRPGIMLYGASPVRGRPAAEIGLRPVMTLKSRLIAVRELSRGDAVGYGGTWVSPETMPVGVVGVGYGDGYPRHAPSGTPVLVRGHRVPLVGRVSMDMISVDLRGVPDARVGDPVTLWGEGLPVDEIAERAATISYELLCRITGRVGLDHRGTSRDGETVSERHGEG